MRPIAELVEERVAPFLFPNPVKPLSSPLIRLEGAAAGYIPDRPVLQNLNLRLDSDDRIGLLGANGNGKSTFAKLLSGRISPMAGHRYCPRNLGVGYFAQHQMDELPGGKTPYQFATELMPNGTEAHRRARIGKLGFDLRTADTPCESLSGGEKARLLFVLATFHAPHLLILDEPTNQLDVDARQALAQALSEYDGAVVMISHDRHLLDACADRLWIVRDGTVRVYDGDIDTYRAACLAETTTQVRMPSKIRDPAKHQARRRAAEMRASLAPLREQQKAAEAAIARIVEEIDAIDALLADAHSYGRNDGGAQKLLKQRGELVRKRTAAEAAWLAAGEAYERAEAATRD
jgi:ATP-binding cassette subfamily F protein 3